MRSTYPILRTHISVYICIEDFVVVFHTHFAHFWQWGIFISILFFPSLHCLYIFYSFLYFLFFSFFSRADSHSDVCSHATNRIEWKTFRKISRSVKNRNTIFRSISVCWVKFKWICAHANIYTNHIIEWRGGRYLLTIWCILFVN